MQSAALKTLRKTIPNMAGWADKIFQGRTKIFNTITENFYPRIKFFGRTIFFLTEPLSLIRQTQHVLGPLLDSLINNYIIDTRY